MNKFLDDCTTILASHMNDFTEEEVNNFDWKVGYSILQVVAGYLVGCPMVGVYTKL